MKWFRICMETPDDGAGGGGEEETGHVSVFNRPDLWDAPAVAEEATETEAPAAEPEQVGAADEPTAPAPAVKPDDWDDASWAGFQKQFPNGTPGDLWKHYSELRTRLSRGEHLQPATPEPEAEPEFEEPPSWRAHNFQSLGAIPSTGLSVQQRTELGELMGIDPEAAAHWAVANSHLLREDEFAAVQNVWAQADQWSYQTFWNEQRQRAQEQREQEEYGPRMEVVDMQRRQQGVAMLEGEMPLFTEHKAEFAQWLEERPQVDEYLASLTEPAQIKETLRGAFYQFYGPYMATKSAEEQAAEAARVAAAETEQAEQAAAAETANRKAVTARRSAPATPAGGEASVDDIRDAIRTARR